MSGRREDKLYFLDIAMGIMSWRITSLYSLDERRIKVLLGWDVYSYLTFRDVQSAAEDFLTRLFALSIDLVDIY